MGRWSRIAVEKVLFGVFTGGDAHVSLGNPGSRATDGLMLRLGLDEEALSSTIYWTTFLDSTVSAVAAGTLPFALWSWV